MGPLIPLFWTSGDVSSGFQSQRGQHYSYFCGFISGVTPADILFARMAGNLAVLLNIPVRRHWWGSKSGFIMQQTNALPIELCRLGYDLTFDLECGTKELTWMTLMFLRPIFFSIRGYIPPLVIMINHDFNAKRPSNKLNLNPSHTGVLC